MDNFKLKAIALKLKDEGIIDVMNSNNDLHQPVALFVYNDLIFCAPVIMSNARFNTELPEDEYNRLLFYNNVKFYQTEIENFLFTEDHYDGFLPHVTSTKGFVNFIFEQISYLPLFADVQSSKRGFLNKSELEALVKALRDKDFSNFDIYKSLLTKLNVPFDKSSFPNKIKD